MSRFTKTRLPLRLLAAMFGVLLLTYLVRRAGPAKLVESIVTLGWGLSLVIALGGVAHLVKTCAWRITLLDQKRRVSFGRMLGLRLASEAVGQLGGLGILFGEGLRVSLLSPNLPLDRGITSVTLDRALFILSSAVVSMIGLVAVLVLLPLPHTLSLYASVFACILLSVILVTGFAVTKRWPVFSGAAHVVGRVRYFSAWIERKRALIHSVENKLLDFYHHTPGSFWASFSLNLAWQCAAVLEVYLILWLMGSHMSLFGAFAVEALTKLVNVVGALNPGNIGTYEGGNMLIVKMFGLSGAVGLTLAFARRLRAIFWAGVGVIWLSALSKKKKNDCDTGSDAAVRVDQEPSPGLAAPEKSAMGGHSHIAIVLANDLEGISFGSPLPRVGGLPVLLRAILAAQKAGATRIVVVIDRETGPWIQRELIRARRLPPCAQWFEVDAKGLSIPSLLGHVIGKTVEKLVLLAGDRIYQPSLQRRAAEWSDDGDALALITRKQLVGILAFSGKSIDFAMRCPYNTCSLEELNDWLTVNDAVQCEQVKDEMWQSVVTAQQCIEAEKKLDRWLVKPTDGLFARMNRRVSIPISHLLMQFPVTPNMVTLFTLGVSFAAGVFFALGGYWNMLLGAILSVLASILDGCDGEIARLKLLESDFGCWLETVCDYLYYLFIFAGMAIGLVRSTGNRTYLLWGAFLVFGAVTSFLTIGLQRRRMAAAHPEQYLGMWHKEADNRSSNLLLYLGRHTEFIIRRCFLPYAFLVFAIFHLTNWAFVGATIGANVVWIVALYSYLTFSTAQPPAMASPVGSS